MLTRRELLRGLLKAAPVAVVAPALLTRAEDPERFSWLLGFGRRRLFRGYERGELRKNSYFILDTRFTEVPVLYTTRYLESEEYLQNNLLGQRGVFLNAFAARSEDLHKLRARSRA